jgi:dihydrofolate reductase
MEVQVRKLIAAMKTSLDGKIAGPEGDVPWVDAWSDDYGLTQQVDACVLGGRMYPVYEQYWAAVQSEPDKPHPFSGQVPTPAEVEWARFAAQTPHYVLSSSLSSAQWPTTSFVRGIDEVSALKQQPGKDIYLVGGATTTASFIEAGLVDELRLIVYPLLAGAGASLFAATTGRHRLTLRTVGQLSGGRVSVVYELVRGSEAG